MSVSPSRCDVLICGGAVIGSSVAWFLAQNPDFKGSIVVVEPDPTYHQSATALSASGIRTQFSSPLNIRMSQFGVNFILSAQATFGSNITFQENGYLYLASTPAQELALRTNHATQSKLGASTILLEPDALAVRFPHLNTSDIRLGSFGQASEGWFDNMGLLNAFKTDARAKGVIYIKDRTTELSIENNRISGVRLAGGDFISCGYFINASGTSAAKVAKMAGLFLPVEPRKRTNFLFSCAQPIQGKLPLMIDPSGVWCRPEGENFLCGCSPAQDPAVDHLDFEPNFQEFEDIIWPALAHRSPAFEAIKLQRFWAGHYDMNTFDQNVIVGPHPEIDNFIFANGFSGHGLQQSPAIGRAISEWIVYGQFLTLDLLPFGYQRILTGTLNPEQNVI